MAGGASGSLSLELWKTRRRIVSLVVLAAVAGLALWLAGRRQEAALLRADADQVAASNGALLRSAVRAGAGVYRQGCASCHGAQGRGDMSAGVPDLTDADWLYGRGLAQEIEQVAEHGIRSHRAKALALADMPAFALPAPSSTERISSLSPRDIADVTEFIRYLGGGAQDMTAAARGGLIYQARGAWFDCHGRDGRGDSAVGAPNLADATWLYGDRKRESIARSIAEGRAGVCPGGGGALSATALRQVALYIHSRSSSRRAGADRGS